MRRVAVISEEYKTMLSDKSVIRKLSEYAMGHGAEIDYQSVFDYSPGGPSVLTPKSFTDTMVDLYESGDPVATHGYSPLLNISSIKGAIVKNLNECFGMAHTGNHIFPTMGAAGALSYAVCAVTKPGDEVITFVPYFPEYQPYVKGVGAGLTIVLAGIESFQINFDAFEVALNPSVQIVLINIPNSLSGAMYSADTLRRPTVISTARQVEYGHDALLIGGKPYHEVVLDDTIQSYLTNFYVSSLTYYSWSRSLSLPDRRIGYVAVSPTTTDADLFAPVMSQISHGTDHNCPPSSVQLGVAKVIDQTADLNTYEMNMSPLHDALISIGFDVVHPGGTFYIFPKALEDNTVAFYIKTKEYDLILVPSGSFGVPGYFHVAYYIDTEKVRRSIPTFERFIHEMHGL